MKHTKAKYQHTLTRVLSPVNCQYGAPMGRGNVGRNPGKSVLDKPVRLVDGYDKGGAYWGYPNNLRVRYTKDLSFIEFYRDITKS